MLRVKIGRKTIGVKDCRGLASLRGLMFDRKSKGALICGSSIWMPFVSSRLDLLFLDKDFNVIEMQQAAPMTLHPKTWRVYSCPGASYCLELRTGIIKNKNPVNMVII